MRIPKYFLSNLTVLTILLFGAVSARAFGEILRNADGSLMYVTHFNAMKACPAGTRLPTAREFASESQARGAKGILEENQVDPNNIPRGYDKVVAFDGPVADIFYFNHEGYKRPDGDLGSLWFIASSQYYYSFNHYIFSGRTGIVDGYYSPHYSPGYVLCILNR